VEKTHSSPLLPLDAATAPDAADCTYPGAAAAAAADSRWVAVAERPLSPTQASFSAGKSPPCCAPCSNAPASSDSLLSFCDREPSISTIGQIQLSSFTYMSCVFFLFFHIT